MRAACTYWLFLFLSIWGMRGQYITVTENLTPDQLVNQVLINNPCGTASNVVLDGWNFGSGNSFGEFDATGTTFALTSGVVLTTGRAASAIGPNSGILSEGPTSWPGDNDLQTALGTGGSINATVLEFDFLPTADRFSFDYVFSSEQYLSNPSSNQCQYTDGLAFLIKKANTAEAFQNIALVPNTTTPVAVNTVRGPGTVCPEANAAWFDAFNGAEHATNYNGQTKIMTATALVEANILYHIKIVIADQGNNLYDSALFLGAGSFRVTKDLGPDRLLASMNPLCSGETLALDATQTGALGYQWYKNGTLLSGETSANYNVVSEGFYEVEIQLTGGCNGKGEIRVEYSALPDLVTATLTQCDPDGDGSATFDLTQANALISVNEPLPLGFSYYESLTDAQNGFNSISNLLAYTSVPKTVYARAGNPYGCENIVPVTLDVNNLNFAPVTFETCDPDDQDGLAAFDLSTDVMPLFTGIPTNSTISFHLSQTDAVNGQNAVPSSYMNTVPGGQSVFIRVVSGSCVGIGEAVLSVAYLTGNPTLSQTVSLCSGNAVTLDFTGNFTSYLWQDGSTSAQFTTTVPGTYSVDVVTADGCPLTKTFTVLQPEQPVYEGAGITDFSGLANAIQVHYSGTGTYTFSLDGTTFQANPLFTGLGPDLYQVYIREEGCGTVFGPYPVVVLDYPRFFTPNGDGYNDEWTVRHLPAGSRISLFDRYGKMLGQLSGNSGWDGTHLGKKMPSQDYWFVLEIPGRADFRAHFSLKR